MPILILTRSQPRSLLSIARSNSARSRSRPSRSRKKRTAQMCRGFSARFAPTFLPVFQARLSCSTGSYFERPIMFLLRPQWPEQERLYARVFGPTAAWRLLASEERLLTFSPAGPRSEADPGCVKTRPARRGIERPSTTAPFRRNRQSHNTARMAVCRKRFYATLAQMRFYTTKTQSSHLPCGLGVSQSRARSGLKTRDDFAKV